MYLYRAVAAADATVVAAAMVMVMVVGFWFWRQSKVSPSIGVTDARQAMGGGHHAISSTWRTTLLPRRQTDERSTATYLPFRGKILRPLQKILRAPPFSQPRTSDLLFWREEFAAAKSKMLNLNVFQTMTCRIIGHTLVLFHQDHHHDSFPHPSPNCHEET